MIGEGEIRASVLRVLHRVAPDIDVDRLDPTRDLRREADLDSVDLLRFIVGLHEELGIEVPEEDYGEIASVEGVVAYLARALRPG